jgi:hypothetical protein
MAVPSLPLAPIYIANNMPDLITRVSEIIAILNSGNASNALLANNATFAFGKSEGQINANSALFANNATFAYGKTEGNLNANSALFANNATFAYGKTEGNLNANSALFANNATFAYGKTEGNLNVNNAAFAYGKTEGNLNANSALFANNATNFNGQPSSFYTNASNITTGTLDGARMFIANTTVNGAISTTTQSFAGNKTFTGTIAWGGGSAIDTSANVAILNGINWFRPQSATGRTIIAEGVSTAVSNFFDMAPVAGPHFGLVAQLTGMSTSVTPSYKVALHGVCQSSGGGNTTFGDDAYGAALVSEWRAGDKPCNIIGCEIDINNFNSTIGVNQVPLVGGLLVVSGGDHNALFGIKVDAQGAAVWRDGLFIPATGVSESCINVGATVGAANVAAGMRGTIVCRQRENGGDALLLQRYTDTSPTGSLIRAVNAINNTELFNVTNTGDVNLGGLYVRGAMVQALNTGIYPGSVSGLSDYQTTYYIASHASYGLYTPGGLRMDGSLIMPASGADIELGSTGASNTPVIDFHSSGNNVDYDVRLISSGGNGVAGNGTLTADVGQWIIVDSDGTTRRRVFSLTTVLNNATTSFGALNGLFTLNFATRTGVFVAWAAGGTVTLISDPSSSFSVASGTSGRVNVYISGGNLTVENKNGSTVNLYPSYIA